MSTVTNVATVAQPAVTVLLTAAVAYAARLLGSGRFDRVVADVERDAPIVVAAVDGVEKVPGVGRAVDGFEARVRAEAERLDAATHGAIDALAGELARTIPGAIQDAIVAAHATVPVPDVAPVAPPAAVPVPAPAAPEAAVRVDTPAPVIGLR